MRTKIEHSYDSAFLLNLLKNEDMHDINVERIFVMSRLNELYKTRYITDALLQQEVIPALIKNLPFNVGGIGEYARGMLELIGSPAVPHLISALVPKHNLPEGQFNYPETQARAACALGEIKDKTAIPHLEELVKRGARELYVIEVAKESIMKIKSQ